MNKRRKLIVALGAGALAAPFRSFAQPQGKVWRVGLMSEGARPNPVLLLLGALGSILKKQGCKISAGAGVEAAGDVLQS